MSIIRGSVLVKSGFWLSFSAVLLFMVQSLLSVVHAARLLDAVGRHCLDDMHGRSVCFQQGATRIVSISPGVTELLFAAGAGNRVVAVDQYSDYPAEARALPKVGGFPDTSVELIAAKIPDLVLWSTGNSSQVIRQLERLGIPTFGLDIRDLEDIDEALRLIGRMTGSEAVADRAADSFSQGVDGFWQRYGTQSPVTVFFEAWRDPLMTVAKGQLIDDLISLCGGHNVYHDLDTPIATISLESLLAHNPQVILLTDSEGSQAADESDRFWRQLQTLQAVREGHLFHVPGDVMVRPSPRVLEAADIVCRQLDSVRIKNKQ